jgi:hypothetical protein
MNLHRTLAACALLALAGAARAQAIDTVAPGAGGPGVEITIDGNGFLNGGTAKPKVFLRDPATLKKTALKVTAFSDTQITAVFNKGLPGERDLVVLPKDGAEIVSAGAFEVMLPDFVAVDSGNPQVDHAQPGAEVTANGDFFGTLKGSLRIGKKKAKVLTWADDAITFQMPPKLEDGFYSVSVKNRVGTDILSFVIIVTGGQAKAHKPDTLGCKVGKAKFKLGVIFGIPAIFTGFEANPDPPAPQVPTVNVTATSPPVGLVSNSIVLKFPFDPNVDAAQPLEVGEPNGSIAYTEPETGIGIFTTWDTLATNAYSIVVYSFTADQFQGVYSGTLDYDSNVSTAGTPENLVVKITKGKFRGTLPP